MRKLRKPLSWLLAVCMLFSLLPGTALAADPDPAPVADTTTYTDWEDLFGVGGSAYLTTKDIGRIWTDKSVSTQDITLPGTNIDGPVSYTHLDRADSSRIFLHLGVVGIEHIGGEIFGWSQLDQAAQAVGHAPGVHLSLIHISPWS